MYDYIDQRTILEWANMIRFMRLGVFYMIIGVFMFASCSQDFSYRNEVAKADSYALYLYDKSGENPLLVDTGSITKAIMSLSLDGPANENCNPYALIQLYSSNKPESSITVYLNGSCYSLKLTDNKRSITYKMNEAHASMITKHQYPAIETFSWLEGTWRTKDSLPFIEQWTKVDGQKLVGTGLKITDTPKPSVKSLEKLELVYHNGTINYVAYVQGQNSNEPVAFQLDENTAGNDTFAFLNPNHDFPQRIAYKRIDEDTLEVTVSELEANGQSFTLTLFRTQQSPEEMLPASAGI